MRASGSAFCKPQSCAALLRRPFTSPREPLDPTALAMAWASSKTMTPGVPVALLLVLAVREPGHDLVEARRLPLPRGGAQRGMGGEQDSLRLGDVGPLAHLAEGNDVVLVAADGAPVASRVLQQRIGLRQPERSLAAPQPLVEDDGGDLPALAAAGAVAQHPAAPEADRTGQRLVGVDGLVGGV